MFDPTPDFVLWTLSQAIAESRRIPMRDEFKIAEWPSAANGDADEGEASLAESNLRYRSCHLDPYRPLPADSSKKSGFNWKNNHAKIL
ncbi:hypothetical protein [Mycolicibacterium murale]|uniref:hypothetical protein n=1 Tax=Mycolicibacterium murale TaxID=182220 RepID=UPI0018773CA8|nr:hypothetical protein [Mycolicibacterium murale]MCV7181105.1 hypothetical protein [Mycolicibacterium murale]